MIDILTGISGKFRSGHLHTQRNFGDFISNEDSTGLTDLNKWKEKKNVMGRAVQIWVDLGGLRPTSPAALWKAESVPPRYGTELVLLDETQTHSGKP
jgi:hypothetical protein